VVTKIETVTVMSHRYVHILASSSSSATVALCNTSRTNFKDFQQITLNKAIGQQRRGKAIITATIEITVFYKYVFRGG
jgi:hypothetical protein